MQGFRSSRAFARQEPTRRESLYVPLAPRFGEALLIVGPQGIGKTTLLQQVALGRLALLGDLLDLPIRPGRRRVLYLAMDRAQQARRSVRRVVDEASRGALDERLVIWPGPLQFNLRDDPRKLAEMAESLEADTGSPLYEWRSTIVPSCL